jgi:hypothetical protein
MVVALGVQAVCLRFTGNVIAQRNISSSEYLVCCSCLQMLASKLGQAPSTLLLGAADAVIAHMLWFSLDSLERFTQFVENVMHPETFIAVVTVSFCFVFTLDRRNRSTSTRDHDCK